MRAMRRGRGSEGVERALTKAERSRTVLWSSSAISLRHFRYSQQSYISIGCGEGHIVEQR